MNRGRTLIQITHNKNDNHDGDDDDDRGREGERGGRTLGAIHKIGWILRVFGAQGK